MSNVPPSFGAPAPYPYQQPPVGPDGRPFLPPPNTQYPSAPRTKSRTPILVAVCVVVVAVAGACAFIFSSSGSSPAASAQAPAVTVPVPSAPVTAGSGGNATGVTLPGPGVSAVVTTVPAPPPTDQTATPVPVAPGGGGPAAGEGTMVPIGNNVTVAVRNEWNYKTGQDSVLVDLGDANSTLILVKVGTQFSAATDGLNTYVQQILTPQLSNVQVGEIKTLTPAAAAFVETVGAQYSAVWVSSQGQSTPIRGVVVVSLRSDGVIVITDGSVVDNGSSTVGDLMNQALTFIYGYSTFA